MKILALISNPLFPDFAKLVVVDSLAEALVNPSTPVDFECLSAVKAVDGVKLASLVGEMFVEQKQRDFIKLSPEVKTKLMDLMNLLGLAGGFAYVENKEVVSEVVEKLATKSEAVKEELNGGVGKIENNEVIVETSDEAVLINGKVKVGSVVTLVKDEGVKAILVDENTLSYDGESLTIVEATKRAFKKAGVTGFATGAANWCIDGQNLKTLLGS